MENWFHWPKTSQEDEIFNKSGDEMLFDDDGWDSLARELLQNSLDAKPNDSEEPVHVSFGHHRLKVKDYDFLKGLRDIIERCLSESQINDNIARKFKAGLEQFNSGTVNFISIQDTNTTGLIGCENPQSAEHNYWYSLLHQRGKSDKNQRNSSGSQGVGKFAPFSFSEAGTIFYGTKTGENYKQTALQGIARLTSFKHGGVYQQPKVVYAWEVNGEITPIYEGFGRYPDFFVPNQIGTTVNILASRSDYYKTIQIEIMKSVLRNFFIAIDRGFLTVEVMGYDVNSDNLDHHMNRMIPKDDLEYQQYQAYKFGKQHKEPFWTLYYDASDYVSHKRVNILKNKGMLMESAPVNTAYRNFVGVCIIEDEDWCRQVKVLENPKHNKFVTKGMSNDSDSVTEAIDFIKQIRRDLKDLAAKLTEPEILEEEDLTGFDDLTNLFSDDGDDAKEATKYIFEDGGTQFSKAPKKRRERRPGPTPPPVKGEIQQTHAPYMSRNGNVLKCIFTPAETGVATCKISIVTDDNRFSNDLKIVHAVMNNVELESISNTITGVSCKEGQQEQIEVTLDTMNNYRLELRLISEEVDTDED